MDIYAENILDHYRHPRGKITLDQPSATHTETNVSCGDTLTVQLMIKDGIVTEIGWSGEGCAISQAAMSLLSEEIMGKSEDELNALAKDNVYELLGVPIGPRRFKCALLGLHALKNTLHILHGEDVQGWRKTVGMIAEEDQR